MNDELILHTPVMVEEVLEYLQIRPSGVYVDCTLGTAGHALAIAELLDEKGWIVGIDLDEEALAIARRRLEGVRPQVTLIHGNFAELGLYLDDLGLERVDGVLFDLGLCYLQVERGERGFSFRYDAPLDMRYDRRSLTTAADLVNNLPQEELARIIKRYGEERFAKRIAHFIVEAREREPIVTTGQLAQIVEAAIPTRFHPKNIHPATRTFQALRIALNRELENLERGLEAACRRVGGGGRVCVISYHSLEDRTVKRTFATLAGQCQCPPNFPVCECGGKRLLRVITRKPVLPKPSEIKANRRARSAKMRVAEGL